MRFIVVCKEGKMDLLQMLKENKLKKTGETKKFSIAGQNNDIYDVYAIPLEYLFYNDQNGRINTTYRKYLSENKKLAPKIGNSEYNKIFESFIYESNKPALNKTLQSIKEKGQQEPGVVLPDGRIIDGNRRFTALRMYQEEAKVQKFFHAVILPLDLENEVDKKIIKYLELDLQLAREERVNYDPIDRIFDVYYTIKETEQMTSEEYRDASGAGNTKGINRDIRLAELIIDFLRIVSPGGNPIDKFYLAKDLQLDGPIEEIESTIYKLKSEDKESIKDAVLVYIALTKTNFVKKAPTLAVRDLKNHVLNNSEILPYYLDAVDERVDDIIDAFESNPIKNSNDLNKTINENMEIFETAEKIVNSTERLIRKGNLDSKRTRVLVEIENIRDNLEEIKPADFLELTADENILAREVLKEITDILYKLRKGW